MFERALQLHQAGRIDEADALYRQVLAQQPRHGHALHLLGLILYQRGDPTGAITLIRQAIDIEPAAPIFHSNLAGILRFVDDLPGAEQAARRSIEMGETPAAWFNLGLALSDQRNLDEAEAAYRRAILLEPNYANAHSSLGAALLRRGDSGGAIEAFRRALAIDPNLPDAHANLGSALDSIHDVDAAVTEFRIALSLDPNAAETRNNLASALCEQGMVDDAIAEYQQALRLKPGLVQAASNVLYAMHFSPDFAAETIYAAHRQWAGRFAEPLTTAATPHVSPRSDRIRVGYVSADLFDHPVGRFLLPALARRNRHIAHATCYATGPRRDEITQQLKEASDAWRDAAHRSDAALADQIRADGIDILIDLAGHTDQNRLLCFARRPVPVQATYLGYPDTTGMSAIDFRITDAIADPPGLTDRFHAERLIRLDRCAWCFVRPGDPPPIVQPTGEHVTFGSFNNLAKVSSATIALWAKLLHAIPQSRLVLKAKGMAAKAARERLTRLFAAQHVDPARLELLQPTESAYDHYAQYNRVDIALDTFPYAGTTTTCEALWMGVPVITLAGQRHASRVGASLLTAAGLNEFIAKSPDEYIGIATTLAADVDRRRTLRSNMREMLMASPLMDASDFAGHFDRALMQMAATLPRTPAPEC